MDVRARAILDHLAQVERLRTGQRADPLLASQVIAVKRFQQRRFEATYADLLASARYGGAARFFLRELYGPDDFSMRDAQFARVVPAMARIFPDDVVATVCTLGELHALSEELDEQMARAVASIRLSGPLDRSTYGQAWRTVGRQDSRARQVDLTLEVGRRLDRFTRSALLRHSLRLMRGPARAAGLDRLQQFLESGFDTFAAMNGAADFLGTVRSREYALAAALYAGRDDEMPELST